MRESPPYRYTEAVILVPLFLLLLIWGVYSLEMRLGANWNNWGIYPRTLKGLRGIFTSPWIHGSVGHLYNNSIPLAILSAALFYFYRDLAWKTLLWGTLLTGILTWAIGRPSYHIGASGLIYVLVSFIFFKGVFTKYYRLVALSLVVVFIYGSMLWYIFPIEDGISWEGHLGGFLSGLFLALVLKASIPAEPKYTWEAEDYREEDDPFMQHFDQDGNFIEKKPEGDPPPSRQVRVRYHYREGDPADQG